MVPFAVGSSTLPSYDNPLIESVAAFSVDGRRLTGGCPAAAESWFGVTVHSGGGDVGAVAVGAGRVGVSPDVGEALGDGRTVRVDVGTGLGAVVGVGAGGPDIGGLLGDADGGADGVSSRAPTRPPTPPITDATCFAGAAAAAGAALGALPPAVVVLAPGMAVLLLAPAPLLAAPPVVREFVPPAPVSVPTRAVDVRLAAVFDAMLFVAVPFDAVLAPTAFAIADWRGVGVHVSAAAGSA